jgi:hypothetical protein
MAGNRKQAQAYILKYIDRLAPGGHNLKLYQDLFAAMNDAEFDRYMQDLKSGRKFLSIVAPNFGTTKISVQNNLAIADEIGHDFFQRLWIGPTDKQPAYLTPVKYLVIDLPLRRQSQHLIKKRSIPDNNRVVDQLTAQPTGPSKGAKISYPELQILAAMNMDESLTEMIKFRGGDKGGYNAMNAMMLRYGTASLKTLNQYATGVESTKTLKVFLTAAHLQNNL